MNQQTFLQSLLEFLNHSPTPFHAVSNMVSKLEEAGFERLNEDEEWNIKPGRYYITRNDSSIIALKRGRKDLTESGIRMVGAHTDSPCLRLKPNAEVSGHGYLRAAVEVYGGVLLNPWFDRDLSMAGRVSFKQKNGTIASALINFERPVAVIPSLAIHLDRKANKERTINAQLHLPPITAQPDDNEKNATKPAKQDEYFRTQLLRELKRSHSIRDVREILDYEISFYDTQAARLIGFEEEFLASARLDNLLSCWIATTAMVESKGKEDILMVANDHEEVGSASASGAQGPFLRSVLERITEGAEHLTRTIDRSLMISADNAHAIHPNYPDRHEPAHAPVLNKGPVLKVNNNQRYASNSETQALFRSLCKEARVPMQTMVARTDMGCGSTIGPITASEIGVPTVDVGVPQLAMHSIRETAGSRDAWSLNRALIQFFKRETLLAKTLLD